jgi:hypothetical protein
MATLLDTLVVALTLDPAGIVKGQKEAGVAFDKTKEGLVKGGKQIEETTKKASLSVGQLRSVVIELFAAFTAGKGLKDFIADVTVFDASTARLAKTLDMSVESLSAFQGAGKLVGATTEDMNSGIQNLVSNYMSWAIAGKSQILPYMNILGVKMRDVSKDANAMQKEVLDLSAALSSKDPAYAAEMAHEMGFSAGFTNFLLLGPDRIKELMKLQKEYGLITKEDAEQAKNLQFNWMALMQVSTSLGRSLMTALTPAMDGILKAFTSLGEWAIKHGDFVKAMMFGLAAAATALGLALAAPHALLIATVAAITALIAAGALLYDDWATWNKGGVSEFGHFYESVSAGWKAIGELIAKVGRSFKTDFLDVITGAGSAILDGLKKAFTAFFSWIRDEFNKVWIAAFGHPLFADTGTGSVAGAGAGAGATGGGSSAAPGGAGGSAAPNPYGDLDVGQRPKDNRNFWQRHAPLRIPTQSGRGFRFEAGHRSDLIAATIPI